MQMDERHAIFQCIRETLEKAGERGFRTQLSSEDTGWSHLVEMANRVHADSKFPVRKASRYLGWIQASCCAAGFLDLDEAKAINLRLAGFDR